MAHISIPMAEMPIELLEFEPVNPLISKCQIKVCYVGQDANRNKSIITKEVATDLAKSIPGCPIVGFYNEATGDFEEHNRIIDLSKGKFAIKDTTRPYGFVSMDAKVWFQWFEDDGVQHEYLCTEGYIWTGQYPEAQRIIDEGNNQSMELDENTLDAFWTKDNNGKPQFFIINEAIMSKLCILGEDVEPCFEGASISKVQFSFEDSFKERLFSFMEQMQEILSNEGGTPVLTTYAVEIGDALWSAIYDYLWQSHRDCEYSVQGIYEDGDQKFVILRNRKDTTLYRLDFSLTEENGFEPMGEISQVAVDFVPAGEAQFSLEAVEAFETEFKKNKKEEEEKDEDESEAKEEESVDADSDNKEEDEDPAEEDDEEKKKKAKYNLDEVVEYQELVGKYAALEGQISELNATIATLTNERDTLLEQNKDLTNFKLGVDREKKNDLITKTFYMLSDDLKKDCIDNIDNYSYDEIEAKLSVICVRNKVSFGLENEKKDEGITYNLENVDNTIDEIPDWVKRVQEVQKEKNL